MWWRTTKHINSKTHKHEMLHKAKQQNENKAGISLIHALETLKKSHSGNVFVQHFVFLKSAWNGSCDRLLFFYCDI